MVKEAGGAGCLVESEFFQHGKLNPFAGGAVGSWGAYSRRSWMNSREGYRSKKDARSLTDMLVDATVKLNRMREGKLKARRFVRR